MDNEVAQLRKDLEQERKAKEEAVREKNDAEQRCVELTEIRDSLRRYNVFLREREAIKRMNIRGGCAFTQRR
jgi:hypothetical protein